MTDDADRSKPKLNNVMTVRQLNLLFSGQDEFGIHPANATYNFTIGESSRLKREAILSKDLPHVHVFTNKLIQS